MFPPKASSILGSLLIYAVVTASSADIVNRELSDDISPRIVGGSEAAPGEYPFFGKCVRVLKTQGFKCELPQLTLFIILVQWSGCGASLIW